MRFSASYDGTSKVLSTAVCVFLLLVAAALQSLVAAAIGALLLALAYAFSPGEYVVADGCLTVHRLIGNVRVPVRDIREARRTISDDLRGAMRWAGSGGLFGYYGLFRTPRLGKSRWYVTNRSNTVVIRTGDQAIVLSPDDPGAFLQALGPAPSVAPLPLGPALGSAGSAGSAAKLVLAAVIGTALGLIPLALLYAPGPDRYTLTHDALTIHDRFYPVTLKADSVDVDGVRIVDLASDAGWLPTRRTNGFSNSHYHAGWFRVASGQKVRLYRTTGEKLVLLPPKGAGTPVLYEPPDPDRFLAELRREWAGGS